MGVLTKRNKPVMPDQLQKCLEADAARDASWRERSRNNVPPRECLREAITS